MIEIPIIKSAFDIYAKHYISTGDYSATTIIDSPRRAALFKRYGDIVVQTPESQAASFVGTAVHSHMETLLKLANVKHNNGYVLEKSVLVPFNVYLGHPQMDEPKQRLLAGKPDIIDPSNKELIDVKTCKVWKLIFDPDKIEWTKQLNIYRWLLMQRKIEINKLTVVAFFLDWIESETIKNPSYPKAPIVEYDIDLWNDTKAYNYIDERMRLHVSCESIADNDLPACTKDEMWERDAEFALMKDDNAKRAIKLFKECTLAQAIEDAIKMPGLNPNSFLEVRYQQRKRCMKFCSINEYCNIYQDYVQTLSPNGKHYEKFPLGTLI